MINSSIINLNSYVCSIFIMSIVVISLICSLALQIQQAKEPLRNHLTRVTIQNDNDYLLGIQCKPGDDDLGFHILTKDLLLCFSSCSHVKQKMARRIRLTKTLIFNMDELCT
ncbi:unnamed protein product [Arabidopsis thaliana]|uniref:Self-incompatibility protein-like protein n=2 Tax=Arabidopsis TaxID=3701 RepID=Q9FI82_ARATH|nr:self-incompatibility protein-like protein [Arabidopsis thaliana]AED90957.1 self-incompatibility protein-like protein [Arabidopsis thaliana]KAG7608272.1 hypothetical protein ISN44_As05g005250 [Arabidopsis suecica]BAB10809.1 unnamed protein product [Arabidopsis thaliana]|eukprot:NP_196223.1 self-incompatibility protein-like protein [Arabidopsis thaliana]